MPRKTNTSPDYEGLVKFLIEPLLDNPESLYVNSEVVREKIWLRVAFDSESRGKVFGRGGRNIQAIRTVLDAAAALANRVVYLDVYDDKNRDRPSRSSSNNNFGGRKKKSRPTKERPRIAKPE